MKSIDLFDSQKTHPIDSVDAKYLIQNFVEATNMSRWFQTGSLLQTGRSTQELERSIYFELGLIQKSLDAIKKVLNDNDINNYGYRIYFGRYNNSQKGPSGSDYKERFTGVLTLTYKKYNLHSEYKDSLNNKIPVIFNLGGLCPPDCPGNYMTEDPLYH
ncbi:MAG: hypothetical protein WAR77_14305 [Saprospiraceae bacterium]